MAMSNLYSKIATKPVKRAQDNMSVTQTNAWMNGMKENSIMQCQTLGRYIGGCAMPMQLLAQTPTLIEAGP